MNTKHDPQNAQSIRNTADSDTNSIGFHVKTINKYRNRFGKRREWTYLYVLLQLGFMLARQLLVLPLELGDEDLPLDLLLLLQCQKLLLELLVAHRRASRAPSSSAPATRLAWWLLARWGELGHLLLLLVRVHAQVHGDGSWRETQGQRRVDVH